MISLNRIKLKSKIKYPIINLFSFALQVLIVCSCDTNRISIEGRCVVFLSISQDEYEEHKNDEGIDEILSDYNFYTKVVENKLNTSSIKFIRVNKAKEILVKLSNKKDIHIKFDTNKNYVATLFSNGWDEAYLEYGVLSEIDLMNIICEIFKVASCGKEEEKLVK